MNARSICIFSLLGLLGSWVQPQMGMAQIPTETSKNNSIYETDRVRVILNSCSRKLQDLICQAIITSKYSDRSIEINGSKIKLIDFDGNEYYPNSFKLANRSAVGNSVETDLIENVPVRANLVFIKVPATVLQVAFLQIQLDGGITTTAKFRNIAIGETSIAKSAPSEQQPVRIPIATQATQADRNLICPEPTKVLYRAMSERYLVYICGVKNPTHFVGLRKDSSEGITLRLRYYDRHQFSADNGVTNYTIADDRLIIRKNNKVVYSEKIQVLQSLPKTINISNPTSKPDTKKESSSTTIKKIQKRPPIRKTVETKPKVGT